MSPSGAVENEKGVADEMLSSDWVNCPVCGKKFQGGDYMINSHLGMLLFSIFFFVLSLSL